eukprot:g81.t1
MGEERAQSIKFVLQPDNFTHVAMFSPEATVLVVKQALENDLRISSDKLKLISEAGELQDDQVLSSCNLRTGDDGQIEIDVSVVEDESGYKMPEKFDVVVKSDDPDVPPKKISILVERPEKRKPYLGGFRNKRSGTIYHHGSTQTNERSKQWWEGKPEKFHRDTQTIDQKTRTVQLPKEVGTQMEKKGLHIEKRTDKFVVPGDYFSSDELAKLKEDKTVVMQCYWRTHKARRTAKEKRERVADRVAALEEEEKRKKEENEIRNEREIQRRIHPRTRGDFEVLYNELENWRAGEAKRVREAKLSPAQRKLELAELLAKETKLLQTIDKLKAIASKENREKRIKKMLKLMSAPKKWELRTGEISEVHTPYTTRSRELSDLYEGLQLRGRSTDERLDVLLHVKWTVKEFDCNLTRDIVNLIDREADLLNRGRNEKTLEGLRKRISQAFLEFIETPEFNPEAARFQRVPRDLMKEPDRRPIAPRKA